MENLKYVRFYLENPENDNRMKKTTKIVLLQKSYSNPKEVPLCAESILTFLTLLPILR